MRQKELIYFVITSYYNWIHTGAPHLYMYTSNCITLDLLSYMVYTVALSRFFYNLTQVEIRILKNSFKDGCLCLLCNTLSFCVKLF